jgi:hypothetical protein
MDTDKKNNYEISGRWLRAFQAAFQSLCLRDDFAAHEKHVENYSVSFTENKSQIVITFVARRAPEEARVFKGASRYGQDVRFVVRKDDYSVISTSFFR